MKIQSFIKSNWALITLVVIGGALRFSHIDHQSVWLDEIHTLNEANPSLSWSEVYQTLLAADPHPPLYFILMQLFFLVFGYSTFVLKGFSALTGVAGMIAIYKLGKELQSKQVGLIAVALLAVNYFHLYYSQEGRMYSLLFLTTTISFYCLVRFIKKPSLRTALFHSVAAALMIYTHFFALFALASQYVILLFFVIKPFEIERKKFLLYSFLSGVVTFILYIPSLKIFIQTTERTSIWIEKPGVDAYTQIFKEFFGFSELVLFFVVTAIVLFFIKLYGKKDDGKSGINPREDKQIFSFFILFVWLVITLLIPLISSFVNLPMIVSRYFINVLPVIILMVAIGIYYIKSPVVRNTILSFIVVFSLTDVIIVKRFYKSFYKSQFREVSQFIAENNTKNDPVVSSLSWYFPFFLNNEKIKSTIVDKNLDGMVQEMIQDSTKIRSFWYVDAHNHPYAVTPETQQFLDSRFLKDKNTELLDAWANHYILASEASQTVDISKFKNIQQNNGDAFPFSVEKYEYANGRIKASGWAYFANQDAGATSIRLLLLKDGKATPLLTQSIRRADVTSYFKSAENIDNSGFAVDQDLSGIPPGKYQLAVYIVNTKTKKEGLNLTDKIIEK